MAQPSPAGVSKERVTFQSDHLTLVGFLFKPDGPGPFPGPSGLTAARRAPGRCVPALLAATDETLQGAGRPDPS